MYSKVCGATKRTRVELLERHIYKHTTERIMECPYCDIISKNSGKGFFKTKQSLIQHVDHMHKDRVMLMHLFFYCVTRLCNNHSILGCRICVCQQHLCMTQTCFKKMDDLLVLSQNKTNTATHAYTYTLNLTML